MARWGTADEPVEADSVGMAIHIEDVEGEGYNLVGLGVARAALLDGGWAKDEAVQSVHNEIMRFMEMAAWIDPGEFSVSVERVERDDADS